MKRLLLLILMLPFIGFSQCPPNGTFNSQAEIDDLAIDYPDCTQLFVLIIEGDDITDLSGLNQITNIINLMIINNPLLQTLDGINPTLAIYSLYEIFFRIENNASLEDVTAITNISFGSEGDTNITIKDNPMLTSLNGFQNIGSTRTTSIINNDALINLMGIGGSTTLIIDGNDSLIDLFGLQDFEGIDLTISNNLSLERLNVNVIITLEYILTIVDNPNLIDINLPEGSGADQLTIKNNINLSVCNVDYICYYLENGIPPHYVDIQNNAPGCNSIIEVEYACGIAPFNDDCDFSVGIPTSPVFLTLGEIIVANNEFATTSLLVPSCNEVADRQDVWFVFDSGDNTTVDVITETGFNLQLWEGDCYDLIQVDNACNSVELLDIPVSTNTIYIVQVWSDTNKRPAGWFNLTVQDGSLSTQEDVFTGFSFYPNPVNKSLHIKAANTISAIAVYNLLGQRVNEMYPNTMEAQLNTEHLQPGMYLVEVTIGNQKATYKIIK